MGMRGKKLLVVEDDPDIQEMVIHRLSAEGCDTRGASSGEEALSLIEDELPDIILLDLMLPGMDGWEVARRLRNDPEKNGIAIIMLTARDTESDILKGYQVGADDYVTKPFSPRVLTARVKALLRSRHDAEKDKTTVIRVRNLTINPGYRQAYIDGETLDLSFTEFEILHFLADKPGWVFTRPQIIDAIRGQGYSVSDRSVDAQVFALRKKLKEYRDYIETVRGVGYRFKQ